MPYSAKDFSADEIIQIGSEAGKSPAEISDALRNWQSQVSSWAAEQPDVDANKWAEGREALNAEVDSKIETLASKQMASKAEELIPEPMERHSFALRMADRAAGVADTFWSDVDEQRLKDIQGSIEGDSWKARAQPTMGEINVNGADIGTVNFDIGREGESSFALIGSTGSERGKDGELPEPKRKVIKLDTPTKADLEAAAVEAEKEAAALETKFSTLESYKKTEDGYGDPDWIGQDNSDLTAQAKELRTKAAALRSPAGPQMLLQDRLMSKVQNEGAADDTLGLDRGAWAGAKAFIKSVPIGAAKATVNIVGGAGDLAAVVTGDNALSDWRKEKIEAIDETQGVNPLQRGSFTTQAGEALGQVVPIIAASAASGGTASVLGASEAVIANVARGAAVATMATQGAAGGADTADALKVTEQDNPIKRRLFRLAGALIEPLSESMGGLVEASLGARLVGQAVNGAEGGIVRRTLTQGATEGLEEVGSGTAGDVASNLIGAGKSYVGSMPMPLDPVARLQEFALGALPGGVMGAAMPSRGPSVPPSQRPESTAAVTAEAPAEKAAERFKTHFKTQWAGHTWYRDVMGDWFQVQPDQPEQLFSAPLNPDDAVEGAVIEQLNRLEATSFAKKKATQNATKEPVKSEPSSTPAPVEPAIEPVAEVDIQADIPPVNASKPRPSRDTLIDETGTDIITFMEGEGMRLKPDEGGEWDWYRQLETEAAASKITKQQAEAAARRGDVSDPAAQLAWVNSRLIDRDAGAKLDAAAEALNDNASANAVTPEAQSQEFQVDAGSLGVKILEAIETRSKAREQGGLDSQLANQEADAIAADEQSEAAFLAHAVRSTGREVNGLSLAQEVSEGSTVSIAGKDFTVDFVDANGGIVTLSNPEIGTATIYGSDPLRVDAVDGQTQQPTEDADLNGDAPFSPAQLKATQSTNERELANIGLPIKTKSRIWGKKPVRTALLAISKDARLPAHTRMMAKLLAGLDLGGLFFSVHADGRLPWAGQYQPYGNGTGELMINTRGRGLGNTNPDVNIAETIVHEALHHATYRAIRGPKNAVQAAAVKNLEALRVRVKAIMGAQENSSYDYQLSNTDEFIAALFTQVDFQQMLASIPADLTPKGLLAKARTVLDELFRTIAEIVTGTAVKVGTVLDEAFSNSLSLIDTTGNATGAPLQSPQDVSGDPSDSMRLRSQRITDISEELQKGFNNHQATQDNRTIDGEPIEKAGYIVRHDADMEMMADNWLDAFVEGSTDMTPQELRATLIGALDANTNPFDSNRPLTEDVSGMIAIRLEDRLREFGMERSEWEALIQKKLSRAASALRLGRKVWDPMGEVIDKANEQTRGEISKILGGDSATLNKELQSELEKKTSEALSEALRETRGKLREALERAREEKARADQERDVGIAIGREEAGFVKTPEQERADATVSELERLQGGDNTQLKEATAIWQRILSKLQQAKQKGGNIFKGLAGMAAKLKNRPLQNPAQNAAAPNRDVDAGFISLVEAGIEFDAWSAAVVKEIGERSDAQLSDLYLKSLQRYEAAIDELAATAENDPAPKPRTKRTNGTTTDDTSTATVTDDGALDRFEQWLMGEKYTPGLEGLPNVDQFARRFIMPQRWDAERFAIGLQQLFPTLNEDIVADTIERINEQMQNRMAAKHRIAISDFFDKLLERSKRLENDQRFTTFYNHIKRATELGLLDEQMFLDCFSGAWKLNTLTAAHIAKFRDELKAVGAKDENGRPILHGMARERRERRIIEAMNRLLPAQTWLNYIHSAWLSKLLSSSGSIVNQFSAVAAYMLPLNAIARGYRSTGLAPDLVFRDWMRDMFALLRNSPLMVTAARGNALGHLPEWLATGRISNEQQTQYINGNDTTRIREDGLGPVTKIASRLIRIRAISTTFRVLELLPWRAIRMAEGLTGMVDAESYTREVLIKEYRSRGLTAREARSKALTELHADPATREAAKREAIAEIERGDIDRPSLIDRSAVIKRRAQELINRQIEERLGMKLIERAELLTSYSQFKSMPAGAVGYGISWAMRKLSYASGKWTWPARFYFPFGRFLGHTFDGHLSWVPGPHMFNLGVGEEGSHRNNLIRETFGSEQEYRDFVNGRAMAGGSLAVMMAGMALAALLANGDDEEKEPFFAITGSGGVGDQAKKDLLKATGKWGEDQIRINGVPVINYGQLPEVAPWARIVGEMMDYLRFGNILYQRQARDGELPGKYPSDPFTVGISMGASYALGPIKRSTYRQWFDLIDSLANITSDGGAANAGETAVKLATKPIDGMMRVPVIVDIDKAMRKEAGDMRISTTMESIIRRIPFQMVGQQMFNAYGEQAPGWDVISAFPSSPDFGKQTQKAASLNAMTGTRRSAPSTISMSYEDGTIHEPTAQELEVYALLSGKIYTKEIIKNEAELLKAWKENGQAGAQAVVSKISAAANKQAASQLFLKDPKPKPAK